MKKKALLFGSLPALAIASGIFLSNSTGSEGTYEMRSSSNLDANVSTFQGADEYYHMLKGDFTRDDWERSKSLSQSISKNRAITSWTDQGPDNIGGRTRGISTDRNNVNHLFAGSVSGGLYESINRANTWQKVDGFNSNLAVSSICQTADGTFYVATGHNQETTGGSQNAFDTGANGDGIFRLESDGVTWSLIEGTENYIWINEIVSDDVNNNVWIACNQGLKKYDALSNTIEDVEEGVPFGSVAALSISPDGSVLVGFATGLKTIVSTDGGATFQDVSDDDVTPNPIARDGSRVEYAISHEKVDGNYRVYASAANSNLRGIWRSVDNGINWERIAPAYDGVTPGAFAPFTAGGGGGGGQGTYDNIITVVPGAPDKIILGGIDCYSWSSTGNWEQISQWFLPQTNPRYVHADNHEMQWDVNGRLYIGNDGGVQFSDNAGSTNPEFHPANRGYNITQFYASGFSAHGDVVGGTQDNGSLANYHDGPTYQEHREVTGGDGFSGDISFINRNLIFTSLYFSGVFRSSDRGTAASLFAPTTGLSSPCVHGSLSGDGCGQFFTNFEMWENPNDDFSTDSITFFATGNFETGEVIEVTSNTTGATLDFELPFATIFTDTLCFNPSLTTKDTVVVDTTTGTSFNLAIVEWEYISGAPMISEDDVLLITLTGGITQTIVVGDINLIDHFFGTIPERSGQVFDMGNEEKAFNVAWDEFTIQDPFQSWFALDMGANGLWLSRNALRFSAPDQGWYLAGTGLGNIASMEFSKDGDYLFIGTFGGRLFRYSGFNDVYSPSEVIPGVTSGGVRRDTLVDGNGMKFVTEFEQIATLGAPVTGIASGAIDDPDHLVVTLGNFSGSNKVRESTNATGASPTFTSLGFPNAGEGAAASGIPCYSVVIDRDDPNLIIVGTEFGVFATETGGGSAASWENVSGDFGNTPIYDMGQNWRTWDEGNRRPGEIYIGTHGAGIWSSDSFLNLPSDNDNLSIDKFVPNINLFPNPVKDAGTVEFDLESNGDVTLQIFGLNGQVVNQVTANGLQAGKNQIAFDANDLPKGTYILRVSSETMSETTKFIKH